MVLCDMCGMQVPLGRNGRCALGHVLAPGTAPVAPPPSAVPPPPLAPPSEAEVAATFAQPVSREGASFEAGPALFSTPSAGVYPPPATSHPPIAPMAGNVALDPSRLSSPLAAQAPLTDMVVVSGGAGKSTPKPLVLLLAVVTALVGAFGGYKLVGSLTGSSDAGVIASDLKLVGAAARPVRAYAPGESHTYRMRMDMEMSVKGVPEAGVHRGVVEVELTEKVISVDKDGVSTVRFSIDRASMTMDGASMPVPGFSGSIDVRVRPDGTIERVGSPLGAQLPPGLDEKMFTDHFRPKLPRNVKVGSTWTDTAPLAMGSGDVKATVRNTVVELSESEAVVESVFDMPFRLTGDDFAKMLGQGMGGAEFSIDGKAAGDGFMTIDRKSGRAKSVDGNMRMTMNVKGGGRSVTMVMNIGIKVFEVTHSAKTV